MAIAHGRFLEAWRLHPFAYPLFLMAMSGVAAPWLVRKGWTPSPRQVGWGLGLLSAAMVVYGGLRLLGELRARRTIVGHPPSATRMRR